MGTPTVIYAGDTVKWNQPSTSSYASSAGWTCAFDLRHNSGNDALTVAGVSDGSGGWNFTITAAQSAALHIDYHWYQITVSKNGERYTLETGEIQLVGNLPASGANFDGRSQTEIDLEAVQTAIRARITGGEVQEYSIGNRSLKKISVNDLMNLELRLKSDLAAERRKKRIEQGLDSGRSVYVKF
ncbi:MAG: hypothetical protein EBY29_11005 [Planctomycetes bacterium]|nr:hypothetical protein [Planctomycetota bacterium]